MAECIGAGACLRCLDLTAHPSRAGISIQEQLDARTAVRRFRVVTRIHPMESYPAEAGLTFPMIEAAFQNSFVPRLRVCCPLHCARLLLPKPSAIT